MKHRIEDASHDLVTPDGSIESIHNISPTSSVATLSITNISPWFVGYELDPSLLFFNGKSVFAQLGLDVTGLEIELASQTESAKVRVQIDAYGPIGTKFLPLLSPGIEVGKIFARDDRRKVRDPSYITRMLGRSDRWGGPLLSLGALHGSDALTLDVVDGRVVAYLTLLNGTVSYEEEIIGLLPTIIKASDSKFKARDLIRLQQKWNDNALKNVKEGELLLVKTPPLHIRTVFAQVVESLLAPGYSHTSASVLQPDTEASGDIYEVFGNSAQEITEVPLEFFTLEPYRENVFFSDRDQLQGCLEDPKALIKAFKTAPRPEELCTATFVVKGHQLETLSEQDWIAKNPAYQDLPGIAHGLRQAMLVERTIVQQPCYQFLTAIEQGQISSQGILLTRFLPSPIMKRLLLSGQVSRGLKRIYFLHPSRTHGDFFSNEDRALLNDLYTFGMPVFWVDERTAQILQYVQKPHRESGLFVPPAKIDHYLKSTVFGVYGSNLVVGPFEKELYELLKGVLLLRNYVSHPLLSKDTPISLITGGGPGAMELANKIAKELGILSCANIADFRLKDGQSAVNEQKQNPYVEAKMTYRLKDLVERQAEFNLDFPIFVTGGIGTDFEFVLEEVRRKVGCIPPTPILLFGEAEYWEKKITSRYQCNRALGTISGSEWVSGCMFCVQTAEQGLEVYRKFFEGTLPVGKRAVPQPKGFVDVADGS